MTTGLLDLLAASSFLSAALAGSDLPPCLLLLIFRFLLGLSLGVVFPLVGALGGFLIAFLEQRIGRRLLERDQVSREGYGHVGEGLVEPVLDRSGVGRSEEEEILAAGVEDRLACLGQAVGERERSVLIERIKPDRLEPDLVGQRDRRAIWNPATSSSSAS